MNKSLVATIIFFILASIIGAILFIFWQLGIFKKESQVDPKVLEIRKQIEFINQQTSSVKSQEIFNLLENLPATTLDVPPIKSEELNRSKLF